MSFWTFVCICGVAGIIGDVYSKRLKYRETARQSKSDTEDLLARIERIERRLGNIESICIEHERTRKFDDELMQAAVGERD